MTAVPDSVAQDAFDSQYSSRAARVAFGFAIRESWRLSRSRTVGILTLPVIAGVLPALAALVLRALIDEIDQGGDRSSVGWLVLLSLLVAYVLAMIVPVRRTLEEVNQEVLEQHLTFVLLEQADQIDFAYFEDPSMRDRIDEVFERPGVATAGILAQFANFVVAFMTVVSLVAVLASIDARLLLWLPPIGLPYIVHRWWLTRVRFARIRTQRRAKRWATHHIDALIDDRRLPESRLLDLGPLFRRRVDDGLGAVVRESRAVFIREVISSLVFTALTLAIIYWSLWQVAQEALEGGVSIGDVAIFAGAIAAIRSAIDNLVLAIGRVRWNLLTVATISAVLALPRRHPAVAERVSAGTDERDASVPASASDSVTLQLDGVTFTYPGGTDPVLHEIDLAIQAGETVGLVGPNGCGKTTLAKLVAGLYLPDAGLVQLDGRPTGELSRQEIKERVSCVFQQYGAYEGSAAENIALGDWERLLDNPSAVSELATAAGLDELIGQLPDGLETNLGKAFGDVRLSGGQEQRFAIARALTRDVPVMVLDEPTASLDADTEFELFELFKSLSEGKATLLISHRFTTLSLADRIIVMRGGRIVERGTHDELLALDGHFRRMHDRSQLIR